VTSIELGAKLGSGSHNRLDIDTSDQGSGKEHGNTQVGASGGAVTLHNWAGRKFRAAGVDRSVTHTR
jgi:hypothetical protein